MAIYNRTFLFIMPDKSGILKFNRDGIYRTDINGSNQTIILAGSFWSTYSYNESAGFLYVFQTTSGNVYRNNTAFNFTAFSSVGTGLSSTLQIPQIVLCNSGRIVYGVEKTLRYTDNAFSSYSSSTFSFGTNESVYEILYEGGNYIQLIINDFSVQKFYRSIDNGLTWNLISNPAGIINSFINSIKI